MNREIKLIVRKKLRITLNIFFDYLIVYFYHNIHMVIKTELCAFSEWKIYPGRGIRYVAKDGRPFLFLSKRTRDFSLRYH